MHLPKVVNYFSSILPKFKHQSSSRLEKRKQKIDSERELKIKASKVYFLKILFLQESKKSSDVKCEKWGDLFR